MTIAMDLKDNKLDKGVKVKRPFKETIQTNSNPDIKKKSKKKITTILLFLLSFIVLGVIGFFVYKGYIFSKDLGFKFDPGSLISGEKKELKKDSTGKYTNALILGVDTRESGALLNTDTLIMVSYNYESNNITMVSIPRDFHVEIEKDVAWYVRINSIYSSAEKKKEGSGFDALTESVERLTGQEIQYYAMVDFKAFVEIIDAVGGVDVNVENSFTDYMYPSGEGYKTVSFKAGPQTMDGETALEYSRSRHSQQNNEGTDYARARRQQKVIIALKEKILSDDSLSNPKTLMNIVSSLAGNIKISDFTLNDVEAAFNLSSEYDSNRGKAFSFVLDPSIGGYSLIEKKDVGNGAYAIGPKLGLGEYEDINEYVNLIILNPEIYSENARILVYDTGLGFKLSKEKTDTLKKEFPYLNIVFAGTTFKDKEGIVVYARTEDYKNTVSQLSDILGTEINEKPEYITSNLNGEDVTILLGKKIELIEN